jgi:hypothetical protein
MICKPDHRESEMRVVNRSEELVADALALLHAHGFTPRIQENGGKHTKIRWNDHGRRFTLIISRTPSDSRARQASRATLKRLLRSPAEKSGR